MAKIQRGGKMEIKFERVQLFKNQTLGTGSYGAVCRALCDDLPCAAKLLYPVFFDLSILPQNTQQQSKQHRIPMKQFEAECLLLSQIKHPNIVQYIGMYRDPDTNAPVLLMELMDNNLTNFLETSQNPLQLHIQLGILHDIALALSFLHYNKIIHRDLSSNNVLLNAGCRAKVTDFGMSKLTNAPYRDCTTRCPGTPVYMSPEALDAPAVYSEKLDCFSFGVLIVQVITRKFPNPTDRFQTMELAHPTQPSRRYQAQIHVSELKRRQNHISLIPIVSPLRQVVLDCLKDKDVERPTAQQLCARIKVTQQLTSSEVGSISIQSNDAYKTVSTTPVLNKPPTTPLISEMTSKFEKKDKSSFSSSGPTPFAGPSLTVENDGNSCSRRREHKEYVEFKTNPTKNERPINSTQSLKPLRTAPKPPSRTPKRESDLHSVHGQRHRHSTSEIETKSLVPKPQVEDEVAGWPINLHFYDVIPELWDRPLPHLPPNNSVPPALPDRSGRLPTSPRLQHKKLSECAPPPPPRRQYNRRPEYPPPVVVDEELPLPPRPPKSNINFGSPRGKSWYHSSLDRKQAETKLRKFNEDGTFIVRDSSKVHGEYSLSICHSNTVIHLRIELRADKKFTLGEGKPAFETVTALIEHHKKETIRFKTGGGTTLKFECPH